MACVCEEVSFAGKELERTSSPTEDVLVLVLGASEELASGFCFAKNGGRRGAGGCTASPLA
jgi:hypothetical protein